MQKKYFVAYLMPSRDNFAQTMNDSEKQIMGEHIAYWTEKINQGKVLAYGPVMDPKSIYGLGIIALDDELDLAAFIANDPAARINHYETFQMMAIVPSVK